MNRALNTSTLTILVPALQPADGLGATPTEWRMVFHPWTLDVGVWMGWGGLHPVEPEMKRPDIAGDEEATLTNYLICDHCLIL